ncbi:MAG: hypothetical protein LIO79_05375 [Rikenellaceae bacterium]|nr:hypothetical protein [Rikenellaceae bacterium]
MHIGDTGALCGDIGYQLGQAASEAIRTVAVNTMLLWCGNRFGKGLIRPGGTYYNLNNEKLELLASNVKNIKERFRTVCEDMLSDPSVLGRFEDCGVVDFHQVKTIGCVGMTGRASGLVRDVRCALPYGMYEDYISHQPVIMPEGDVMARFKLRYFEAMQSCDYILKLLDTLSEGTREDSLPDYKTLYQPDSIGFSFTEGWRGEICHVAVTDKDGKIIEYKIKDPSFHNWYALSLCVRGMEISDFPICNKSFNLSYCGHDL